MVGFPSSYLEDNENLLVEIGYKILTVEQEDIAERASLRNKAQEVAKQNNLPFSDKFSMGFEDDFDTAVYDGFVGEETLAGVGGTISFLCEYKNGSPVGDYEIQPEVTGLANYEVTANKGTLSVLPRTPEFVDSKNLYTTRVYDGKAVDLTPATDGDGTMSRVITNRETNEILTSDPVDVGEYRVVYSVSEGQNYTEGSVSYDFAITPAPLVITAENKDVVFGAKAPEYTVVYDGFVNGETEAVLTGTLVVTCAYTEESRESAYEIVPSGLSAKNYAITWKNGVLTGRYPESDDDDYEETGGHLIQMAIWLPDGSLIRFTETGSTWTSTPE
jgi:hypothetical protein